MAAYICTCRAIDVLYLFAPLGYSLSLSRRDCGVSFAGPIDLYRMYNEAAKIDRLIFFILIGEKRWAEIRIFTIFSGRNEGPSTYLFFSLFSLSPLFFLFFIKIVSSSYTLLSITRSTWRVRARLYIFYINIVETNYGDGTTPGIINDDVHFGAF